MLFKVYMLRFWSDAYDFRSFQCMIGCPRIAMLVENVCGTSISFRRLISKIVSPDEVAAEIYSASAVYNATHFCFLVIQRIDLSPSLKRFPLVDLRLVLSTAESAPEQRKLARRVSFVFNFFQILNYQFDCVPMFLSLFFFSVAKDVYDRWIIRSGYCF